MKRYVRFNQQGKALRYGEPADIALTLGLQKERDYYHAYGDRLLSPPELVPGKWHDNFDTNNFLNTIKVVTAIHEGKIQF
jgi:hypothetical protein